MTHYIKLAGMKGENKDPHFSLYKGKDNAPVRLPNSLTLNISGVKFKQEDYQGTLSYKFSLQGVLTTDTGATKEVTLQLGGSSLAKGMLNSFLNADPTNISNIQLQVYKTKDGNYGTVVKDLNLPNNNLKGKDNSQVLQWLISGTDRDALLDTVKIKGKELKDDFRLCQEFERLVDEKFQSYPFKIEQKTTVSDSAFDDVPYTPSQTKTFSEDIDVNDIPF
jgi:hypothetical protein